MSVIGSSFQSSSKTWSIPYKSIWYPPFVDENSPMFYLQLNGDRQRWDREKFVGSRGQCLIYFKRASTFLVNDSRNQLGSVLGTQSKKAFDDFGVRCKTRHLSRVWRWSKSSNCFEWTDAGEWSFYSNKWPDKEMSPDRKVPIVSIPQRNTY